jgi:hypothetical protein
MAPPSIGLEQRKLGEQTRKNRRESQNCTQRFELIKILGGIKLWALTGFAAIKCPLGTSQHVTWMLSLQG